MLSQCCSILVFFVISEIAQASLLGPNAGDITNLERLQLERDLKGGVTLLREILEKSSNVQPHDLERLTEPLRTKRCRWKLCGTGRRFFRYY